MPGPRHEGNEGLRNPESRPVPTRTGLVIRVDSLTDLQDPEALPLKGLKISPQRLGTLFEGMFHPVRKPEKHTSISADRSRRVDSLVASSGETGGSILVSDRVIEIVDPDVATDSGRSPRTEIHTSALMPSTFEALYVPESERAILTYPTHHEKTFNGSHISYGELVTLELSGAMAVIPGGVPYDVAPADGKSVRIMYATNDYSSLNDIPKPVTHVEALNATKYGGINGNAIYARGHGLGIGREVKGIQGEETVIGRQLKPEVTTSDIIDTRNLVPDGLPHVDPSRVFMDIKTQS